MVLAERAVRTGVGTYVTSEVRASFLADRAVRGHPRGNRRAETSAGTGGILLFSLGPHHHVCMEAPFGCDGRTGHTVDSVGCPRWLCAAGRCCFRPRPCCASRKLWQAPPTWPSMFHALIRRVDSRQLLHPQLPYGIVWANSAEGSPPRVSTLHLPRFLGAAPSFLLATKDTKRALRTWGCTWEEGSTTREGHLQGVTS